MFAVLKSILGSTNKPAAAATPVSSFLKDIGEGIANAAGSLAGGLFSAVGGAPQSDFSQLTVPQRPAEKPSLSEQLGGIVRRAQHYALIGRTTEPRVKSGEKRIEKEANT